MQSLYRLVLWDRGAVNALCCSLRTAAALALTSHWLLASSCSPGRQPCLHTACTALKLEEAPRLQVGLALAKANAAEQINGLVWFWALKGDWCWLFPGKL